MSKPVISVIIPTYKDWDRVSKCLQALMEQTYPQHSFEVIVVNNDAEEDVPGNLKEEFPRVNFLNEHKPGSYAARNCALKKAQGGIIAFTDADCRPAASWLEEGFERITEPQTDRLAGKIDILVSEHRTSGELYDKVFGFPQEAYVADGFCATANLICRKDLFEKVGLFNEELKSGGDYEWNLRATKMGYDIAYIPEMVVTHPARGRREIFRKSRRVYAKEFTLDSKSFVHRFVVGVGLLRPPLRHLMRVVRLPKKEFSGPDKLRIVVVIIMRRFVEVHEHFRLLFGGEARRT